jgi:multiple sugar transport system substrate-binding protein
MIKRTGRIIVLLINFLILCSALGCGQSASTDAPQETTITIAARDGSHSDVINAVKESFEKENNCTINVIPLSSNDIYSSAIEDAKNDVGKYDIIMIDDPLMPEYIEKGILRNLTQLDYVDDEDFVEKSRLLGKDPYPLGATYALPFSGNVQLIFFNSDLLKDKSSFDNWDEILSACKELKNQGKTGYAIRGQSGNPIVSDFLPILWAFGGDLFDDNNNLILDSPQSREALEFYCELYKTGGNYEKDELVKAITSGEAGVALGWPSWFMSENGPTAAISQIPGKKTASSEVLATGEIGNWLLGITSNSANPDLALKCAVYLTSRDVQKQAVAHGGIPTRKSVFRDSSIVEKYPFFDMVYMGTNNSRVRPRTTKWSRIEEVFGDELVKCIEENQSIDETITNSQKRIQELVKEY